MIFEVEVQKYQYVKGKVRMEAETLEQAVDTVNAQITSGAMQSTFPEWSDPVYEDGTFEATGEGEPIGEIAERRMRHHKAWHEAFTDAMGLCGVSVEIAEGIADRAIGKQFYGEEMPPHG